MKIFSAIIENFGSYEKLEFSFDKTGLTLISGPTGSGKSTLCDVIPWGLFGVTAKNGKADDIISWNTKGPTSCLINLEGMSVYRSRNPNDLYYTTDGTLKRGKDLLDTQKQINQLLGVDATTYLAASYFHEFSQTAQFFTATAKSRRMLTEELADLSLAINVKTGLTTYVKQLKKDIESQTSSLNLHQNSLNLQQKALINEKQKLTTWANNQKRGIENLEIKAKSFESDKLEQIKQLNYERIEFNQDIENKLAEVVRELKSTESKIKPGEHFIVARHKLNTKKIEIGDTKCKECGSMKDSHKHLLIQREFHDLEKQEIENNRLMASISTLNSQTKQLNTRVNPYVSQIEKETTRENTYLTQLEDAKLADNPYFSSLGLVELEIEELENNITLLAEDIADLKTELSDSELLDQVVDDFRGCLITNTVSFLEHNTNDLLTKHFDAEIKVKFSVADADKLEVDIMKDGNTASFTQLSKGQRQLLKLAFGVSVMKQVSNFSGVDINCVFLDECLDGMDDVIKAKAFTLLESMSLHYDSIFCVEHSEAFKAGFNNRIDVTLVDGHSEVQVD